jgi:hypothetical protein
MSQKKLAEEVTRRGINLSQQNVNSIESGVVARPRALPELAAVLHTTIEWLQAGEGPEEFGSTSTYAPKLLWSSFQLLGSGHTRKPYIMELPIRRGFSLPYSFYMIGTEMSPVIEDGDEIGVFPTTQAFRGTDCVFLQKAADEKRLIRVGRLTDYSRTHWDIEIFGPPGTFRLPTSTWIEAHPIAMIKRIKVFEARSPLEVRHT